MYTEFYNLKEKPFNLTPSSRFLYLGEIHKEALALLTYGVVERKGFILLTGEVGTGKTTMIHALLDSLDEDVKYVYITNPLLSQEDFIKYLAHSTMPGYPQFESKAEFLFEFEAFLHQCRDDHKNFILIVDEAQKLSFELLEEIRLLSNMEDDEGKLINIFLVGQPEFNEILSEPECRPILQRISIRYHIKPLDMKAAQEYILTRLRMAGLGNGFKLFPKDVIKNIIEYSNGYPRMINILADNTLLLGYARGKDKITSALVKECYDDLQLENSFLERTPLERHISAKRKLRQTNFLRNRLVWAAIIFLLMGSAGFLLGQFGMDYVRHFFKASVSRDEPVPVEKKQEPILMRKQFEKEIQDKKTETVVDEPGIKDIQPDIQSRLFLGDSRENSGEYDLISFRSEKREAEPEVGKMIPSNMRVVTVKEGDSITTLAIDIYGNANKKLIDMIKNYNPEIQNINFIEVGQKIAFPESPVLNKGQIYTVHVASFKPFTKAQDFFQSLITENYEAYMIPVYDANKGKLFRITLGNFREKREAKNYASLVLEKGISDYAQVIELDTK